MIDNLSGYCHYFDFGRYHAPYQHGRVGSAITNHDLEMETKAVVSDGILRNFNQILVELSADDSCHGSGSLHAAYCNINFEEAFYKANKMQNNSPIRYGPFVHKGTNCSRFVSTVILSGKLKWHFRLVLANPKKMSPTPVIRCFRISGTT